jgi:hypothetical protein
MYVLYINGGHPPWNLVYPFQNLKFKLLHRSSFIVYWIEFLDKNFQ